MPTDNFVSHSKGLESPASKGVAVTTHDTNELDPIPRAIYVGGAGNIVATMDGVDVTFVGVQAGSVLPIRPTKIKTASTATSMVALS